eukprot:SAG31_NODE_6296_length_2077_cov_6.931066_2_plen_424_part_01
MLQAAGIGSLTAALSAYFAGETLEGIQCEGSCGEKRPHESITQLAAMNQGGLPYYLPLALKRFAMDWGRQGVRVKLADWLAIPQVLDLQPFVQQPECDSPNDSGDDDPTTYTLTGVLMHTGGAMAGHYFAYLKDVLPVSNNAVGDSTSTRWLRFNDASVSALSEDDVARAFVHDEPPPAAIPKAPTTVDVMQGTSSSSDPAGALGKAAPHPDDGSGGNTAQVSAASAMQAAFRKKQQAQKRSYAAAAPAVGKFGYMLIYTRDGPVPSILGSATTACNKDLLPSSLQPPAGLAAEVTKDNADFAKAKAEWEEEQRYIRLTIEIPSSSQAQQTAKLDAPAEANGVSPPTVNVRILKESNMADLLMEVANLCPVTAAAMRLCDRGPKSTTMGLEQTSVRLRRVHRGTGLSLDPLCDPNAKVEFLLHL